MAVNSVAVHVALPLYVLKSVLYSLSSVRNCIASALRVVQGVLQHFGFETLDDLLGGIAEKLRG